MAHVPKIMNNQQTTVILFRGRPGVGKTTISNAFATEREIPILRKDDIYDISALYISDHKTRNKISYDSMFKILETNSLFNTQIVLDFPFNKEGEIKNLYDWCNNHNMRLISALVICSDRKIWESRFNKRSENPTPNQLITNLNELEKHYGDLNVTSLKDEIVLDTINSTEDILKQLETHIPKFQ